MKKYISAALVLSIAILASYLFSTVNPSANTPLRAAISTEDISPLASPGVTLFGESGSATVKLLNMKQELLHSWPVDAARVRLLPNGNLLTVHGTKWGWSQKKWDELRQFVREYSWEGEIVWEYKAPGPAHHDVQRLSNGNTLIVYRSLVPKSAKLAIEDPAKRNAKIRTDIIQEVAPNGEIVWEWAAHENLDLNSCGSTPCPPLPDNVISGKGVYDWTHVNGISVIPENRLFDSGDDRFRPGNILVTVRNWSTLLLINRKTGETLWSYDNELSYVHEGIMIEKGLPGAGNILLFHNGREQKRSQVLEIAPITKKIVWKYEDGQNFFSRAAGVAQRLPNGNTLISEDVPGEIFEVTASGVIVWHHQAPTRTARARRYPLATCPQLSVDTSH